MKDLMEDLVEDLVAHTVVPGWLEESRSPMITDLVGTYEDVPYG